MPRPLGMKPDELKYYILQNAGNKTRYQMHVETEVNELTISKYASLMGVSLVVTEKIEKREKLRNAIREQYDQFTAKQFADQLKMPVNTVRYHAWSMGIVLKRDTANPVPIPAIKHKEKLFNPHLYENWIV